MKIEVDPLSPYAVDRKTSAASLTQSFLQTPFAQNSPWNRDALEELFEIYIDEITSVRWRHDASYLGAIARHRTENNL